MESGTWGKWIEGESKLVGRDAMLFVVEIFDDFRVVAWSFSAMVVLSMAFNINLWTHLASSQA